MQKIVRIASPLVGLMLLVAVCVPWFHLPILGYEVPAPAWNRTGLTVSVAGFLLLLRAILGQPVRWLVRCSLFPAAYFWWGSLQDIKAWGSHTLGPTQLKMATLNSALAKLGSETVTLYDPMAWKKLEPTHGWYMCGAALLLAAVLTVFDGPRSVKCGQCQSKTKEDDTFCFQCGVALIMEPICVNCGSKADEDDRFCRSCGGEIGEKR